MKSLGGAVAHFMSATLVSELCSQRKILCVKLNPRKLTVSTH